MNKTADNKKQTRTAGKFFGRAVYVLLLVALRASAESVTIAWTPSNSQQVAGFKIYYGPSSRVYTNALTVGDTSRLVVPGLVAGNKYFLAVTSCDAAGAESTFSEEIVYVVPLPVVVANNAPAQIVTSPAATVVTPTTTPPPSISETGVRVTRAVAARTTAGAPASSAVAASAAKPVATSATTDPSAGTKQTTVVAKAKVASASRAEKFSASPEPTATEKPPTASAKTLVSTPEKSAASEAEPTLAETMSARAAQFYATVTPFEMQGNGRLDVTEQIALMDGLMKDTLPLIGVKQGNVTTAAEASEITLWISALHSQIRRFDFDRDEKLAAAEQSALAAALETDERLLPLFAPLMLDQEPAQSR